MLSMLYLFMHTSIIEYCIQYSILYLLLLGTPSQLVTMATVSRTNDSTSEPQVGPRPVLTTPTESTRVAEDPETPHTPHCDHSVHKGTHVLYCMYLSHSSLSCHVYSVYIPVHAYPSV